MVVTCLPTAAATGITQERTALPSTCTVHEPHCATPQPYLVPVSPICSRIAHKSGVLGSTFTSLVLPLMVSRAMDVSSSGVRCREYPPSRPERQAQVRPGGVAVGARRSPPVTLAMGSGRVGSRVIARGNRGAGLTMNRYIVTCSGGYRDITAHAWARRRESRARPRGCGFRRDLGFQPETLPLTVPRLLTLTPSPSLWSIALPLEVRTS